MEMPRRLAKFLRKHKVNFEVQHHPQAFTALEIAEASHVSGHSFVKVVMVKVDEKDAMVVLPADRVVDLFKLSTALGTHNVRVEDEVEFRRLFPDCEAGGMPPFGKLYGIPCYVDESLREADELYFNAGSHLKAVKISETDFMRVLNRAVFGDFSVIRRNGR